MLPRRSGHHRRPCGPDVELPAVNAETVSRLSLRLLPGWYDDWIVLEQQRRDQLRLHALEAAAEVLLCRGQLCSPKGAPPAARSQPSAQPPSGDHLAPTPPRATGELRCSITRIISECSAVS